MPETYQNILALTWNRADELDLLQQLDCHLKESGHKLFSVGYGKPAKSVDIEQLSSFYSLDGISGFSTALEKSLIPSFTDDNSFILEDQDFLLQREQLWQQVQKLQNENHEEVRKKALSFYLNFYTAILQSIKPSLVLIWNGQHPQEIILDKLCRKCECPVLYIERGPFRSSLQISTEGCTAGTQIAKSVSWEKPENPDLWKREMDKVEQKYKQEKATWYLEQQPKNKVISEIRDHLKIPVNKKVVLFTGQLDNDTSNFLYSPNFKDNLSAFSWLCDFLRERNDIFILGKHHPLNQKSIQEFQSAVGELGVWVDDISLENCFDLADRVATVNSTTLFEAIMLGKPTLTMGESLISNKNISYEIMKLEIAGKVITDWLDARDFEIRRQKWLDFSSYLLAKELYFVSNFYELIEYQDAYCMAKKIINMIKDIQSAPDYSRIQIQPSFVLAMTSFDFWQDYQKKQAYFLHSESMKQRRAYKYFRRLYKLLSSLIEFPKYLPRLLKFDKKEVAQ
jgi:hypothetical protein